MGRPAIGSPWRGSSQRGDFFRVTTAGFGPRRQASAVKATASPRTPKGASRRRNLVVARRVPAIESPHGLATTRPRAAIRAASTPLQAATEGRRRLYRTKRFALNADGRRRVKQRAGPRHEYQLRALKCWEREGAEEPAFCRVTALALLRHLTNPLILGRAVRDGDAVRRGRRSELFGAPARTAAGLR